MPRSVQPSGYLRARQKTKGRAHAYSARKRTRRGAQEKRVLRAVHREADKTKRLAGIHKTIFSNPGDGLWTQPLALCQRAVH